jgi:hypothetical protein
MSDLANNGLTMAVTKDGQQTPTANLPMGGFRHTNVGAAVNSTDYARYDQVVKASGGAMTNGTIDSTVIGGTTPAAGTFTVVNTSGQFSLASASTVAIGAATANSGTITGTTTITAFDTVAAGIIREVTFAGSLTLTHNSTSLILPGAGNIQTQAGDCATFESLGSGNWRCIKYSRASIAPSIEGTAVLNAVCGTSGTITLGNSTISYAKIGSMVFFTGVIDVAAVSSPTGSLSLMGLPYASGNNNRNFASVSLRISGGTQNISGNVWQGDIAKNATGISITYYNPSTGTEGSSPAAQVMANTSFTLSGMYMVN